MATTTITANATTRRPAEITKASYAPLAVLALAQIGTSSDSAAMNLATASLVGIDKEFRYLRTVIVTAAVYWGLNSKLRVSANLSS